MQREIVIFGAGGHAKVVYDILVKESKFRPIAFVGMEKNIKQFLGLPYFHQDDFKNAICDEGIVALGDNWTRQQVVNFILSQKPNFNFISTIHPSAQIGTGVLIGKGAAIMAGAVINPDSNIGSHVIINTNSSVDHDCQIGDFASIAPGAILGGNVLVGSHSAISLGAKIIHAKKIGNYTVIGAGAVVLKDFGDRIIAYGNPCREIRSRAENEKYL